MSGHSLNTSYVSRIAAWERWTSTSARALAANAWRNARAADGLYADGWAKHAQECDRVARELERRELRRLAKRRLESVCASALVIVRMRSGRDVYVPAMFAQRMFRAVVDYYLRQSFRSPFREPVVEIPLEPMPRTWPSMTGSVPVLPFGYLIKPA